MGVARADDVITGVPSGAGYATDRRAADVATATARPAATAIAARGGWIVDGRYDGLFFVGSVFAGLAYGLAVTWQPHLAAAGNPCLYVGLGLAHFGTTWFFYLDRENRAYYAARPWRFFYGPALVVAASLGMQLAGPRALLIAVTYWFSGFHVMKQSTGFAALYRSRLGLSALPERRVDNAAILGVSLLCLVGRLRLHPDFDFRGVFDGPTAAVAYAFAMAAVATIVVVWVVRTVQRWRRHGRALMPLALFTLASFALFTPFVYVERLPDAFMASLTGHYAQYVGFVWLVNRRKYTATTVPRFGSPMLARVSQSASLLVLVLLAYGVTVTAFSATPYFPAVGLTWAHFFVDRYLFRFREPEIRKMIMPYLA
jgi:hypothetical protein